jgi:NAD+ kinase
MSLKGRVAILGHTRRPAVRREAERLRRLLARRGVAVRFEETLALEMGASGARGAPLADLARWCDVLVSLGGDGTALAGARALAGRRGALLPINLGGLGFLTVAEAKQAEVALLASVRGEWPIARRGALRAHVLRRGRALSRRIAMNDVVVKGAGGYAAIHLRIEVLGHDLGLVVADGLIVASAAGSTAYSLSAGGPVLEPEVQGLVLTPVCAHSLGSRSLVLSPRTEVRARVLRSNDRAVLLFDGQERLDLMPRDEVRVRLVPDAVRVFQNPERPFARTLQSKLGWQGSARRSR